MTGSEKDAVMTAFAAGEYQVLVSTTVIEVGIDVPNATVMVIEDADRFGLAQLHQLRGRVGRGEHPGYCALITKSATPPRRERLLLLDGRRARHAMASGSPRRIWNCAAPASSWAHARAVFPASRSPSSATSPPSQQAREAAQLLFEQDPQLASFPQLSRQVERFWRGQGDVN